MLGLKDFSMISSSVLEFEQLIRIENAKIHSLLFVKSEKI